MAAPIPKSLPAPRFKLEVPGAYFGDESSREPLAAALAGDIAQAKAAIERGASPDAEGAPRTIPATTFGCSIT